MSNGPTGYHWFLFGTAFLGGVFGGVAAALMPAYLPDAVRELGAADPSGLDRAGAVINAAYLFGMTAGGLLIGFLSDRAGRKPASLLAIVAIGAFMLLTGLADGWAALVAFRFLTGFGVGGVLVAPVTFVAEEWPERSRHLALGILSVTIPVGIFSAGAITYFFTDWRQGFSAGLLPLLLAVVGWFFLKESEKWAAARRIPKKERAAGASIFDPSLRRDLLLGSAIYGAMLIGLWAIFAWLPTWVEGLVAPGGDGQKARGTSMMLFAVGGLAGGFSSGWAARRFGVRRCLLVCFAGTFASAFLLFKTNSALNPILWSEIALIALFFGASQGVLNVYIPALFPVGARSAATGFCFNICRVFTASVVFFVGWLEAALGGYGNALFVFSFVFLLGWVASLFAREKQLI